MGAHPSGPTLIQSVQRALHLVELVADSAGPALPKTVARRAGLPLATTYHLLRTCAHEGWLQRLDDGSYVLGHRIDALRLHAAPARGLASARPALEWLRDELHGPVYLARWQDGEVVVAEIVDGPRSPRIDLWVGLHDAAHATALGKSVLGQLTAAERADWLARHPLVDLTPRTVVDRRRLHLPTPDQVARDDGEYAVGVCCLAAAAPADGIAGAVGVVTTEATSRRPGAAQTLRSGAQRVARALALAGG
jgi:DNA-binding IclR family transcriptional regulator